MSISAGAQKKFVVIEVPNHTMTTLLPPPSKREKLAILENQIDLSTVTGNALVEFKASDTGEITGTTVRIPARTTARELELLLNQLLNTTDDPLPYSFSLVSDTASIDVISDLYTNIIHPGHKTSEDLITLSYTPQAVFRVRTVTRCTGTIAGHGAAILAAQFSPRGSARVVTGSGDCTARIWDSFTSTPMFTLEGHSNWVLCVAWSPDAKVIATGSYDNTLRLWDPETGKAKGEALRGHSKWITALAWEPLHLVVGRKNCRLASSSKDTTIKVWDTVSHRPIFTLSGHTAAVTCLKWGGKNWLYSGSQDKSIRIWDAKDGKSLHILSAHAHWVNTMSLSTDFVIRTGAYDHTGVISDSFEENTKKALERYRKARRAASGDLERLVTGSDDFTMFLWEPEKSTKPVGRLTGTPTSWKTLMSGHQKLINHVSFSPDGRWIASASFDNSVKLWDGRDGKFVATLRGHVAPVYQCCWSSDSRLLVSSSKDTTLKVWDCKTHKLKNNLPGHDDEVYAVDWSPDGQHVASGGKDKKVRLFGF